MQAGIPYPGYYLIDPNGTIQKRFFETAYVNRLTANHHLYKSLFDESISSMPARVLDSTPHVTVTLAQSDEDATPGAVVRLDAIVEPGSDTHIYAPGRGEVGLVTLFR